MSESGLPQFLIAACEASMAMSVTALLQISSLCFMVAWPSIASSGCFFKISSDITTNFEDICYIRNCCSLKFKLQRVRGNLQVAASTVQLLPPYL
ncbi:hypothetical protein SDJN02_22893, partial [Cucurbita argyrosperma subsp. argyrosperma]